MGFAYEPVVAADANVAVGFPALGAKPEIAFSRDYRLLL
jgi:hypothetical protein